MLIPSTIAQKIPVQFLFNQYSYLNSASLPIYSFADKEADVSALFNCIETSEGTYISGYRAPFAGIECSKDIDLDLLINDILKELSKRNARSLTVKQAPECYQPQFYKSIHEAFIHNGFAEQVTERNQHILVSATQSFAAGIDAQKRRRLNNSKKLGMHVELFDHVDSGDWYEVYTRSRIDKGFPITISRDGYYALSKNIPGVYTYAGVFLNNRLIANAVFVRVNAEVLYYFVAASDPAYAELSPTVLLIEALYEKAVQEKYSMIDLGISSVDGLLNEGLHQFKKHVGGIDSDKKIYTFLF